MKEYFIQCINRITDTQFRSLKKKPQKKLTLKLKTGTLKRFGNLTVHRITDEKTLNPYNSIVLYFKIYRYTIISVSEKIFRLLSVKSRSFIP